MTEYLVKDVVYVNSYNRLSGTTANFTVDVSQQVRVPNEYDSIVLIDASIPKSYYLISNLNNTFQIAELGFDTKTITLTNGNYTLTSMTSAITDLITAAGLQRTYTFAVSEQTGKATFTCSAANSSIIFGSNSPWRVLGFAVGTYSIANIGGSYSVTSPNVVNFQLTNTIQIMSNIVDKGVLSCIIPSQSDFGYILYNEQNADLVAKPLISTAFNSIQFYLLDGITGQPLDLNGLDVQFTVVLYKVNSYFRVMLEDHKLQLLQSEYEKIIKHNENQLTQ